jgi:hypothetical protein
MKITGLQLLLICLFTNFIYSQQNIKNVDRTIKSTQLTYLGKTRPVKELIELAKTSKDKSKQKKAAGKKPLDFILRGKSNVILPELQNQGPDPVLQNYAGRRPANEPLVNVRGLGEFSPNDPTGDVGLESYVQMVNATDIGVYDKTGELIHSFAAVTLWSEFGVSSEGDPIVLYDEQVNRWLLTEFTDPANVLIAISDTDDPLGSYTAYNFSTPHFPDYPKYAIWSNAYVITTNEEGPDQLHQYFLDRNAMLAGSETVTMQRISLPGSLNTEAGFYVSTPVDWNGNQLPSEDKPIVMVLHDSSWGGVPDDRIEFYRFDINWKDEDSTVVEKLSIVTSPFDSYPCAAAGFGFACIPQKGGEGLDGIPETIMNVPHYRRFSDHESIVLCFISDATQQNNISGIRWVELRKTPDLDWHLHQEGTYAPQDGLHRFMGGIAINDAGDIGLAYNVSGDSINVGVRYTGRLASDPLGVMSFEETVVIEGASTVNSFSRFGDYSQMSVDPTDKKTFWFTSEYAGDSGRSDTRIVAFQLSLDSIDLAVKQIKNPTTSSTLTNAEKVTATISNRGLLPQNNFVVELAVDNVIMESKTITEQLLSGQNIDVEFETQIDFSQPNVEKQITVRVDVAADKLPSNNRKSAIVKKLLSIDGSISAISQTNTIFCNGQIHASINLKNEGESLLQSVSIEFSLNGLPFDTVTNNIGLPYLSVSRLSFLLNNIAEGEYVLSAKVIRLNGQTVEQSMNKEVTFDEIEMKGLNFQNKLFIRTDNFPEENNWQLTYKNSDIPIYYGGPLEGQNILISVDMCLNPDSCYTFKFFDSFSDGICCQEGNGNINFRNISTNKTIFMSNGQFNDLFERTFCIDDVCAINLQHAVQDDNGSGNGSISITATNGLQPYMYSIDGGQNFVTTSVFSDLMFGTYAVVVKDATGICEKKDSVEVKFFNAVNDLENLYTFTISPNPNNGYFSFLLKNKKAKEHQIFFTILDANGRIVQKRKINKYGDAFEASVSMMDKSAGIYYIQILGDGWSALKKFVKK